MQRKQSKKRSLKAKTAAGAARISSAVKNRRLTAEARDVSAQLRRWKEILSEKAVNLALPLARVAQLKLRDLEARLNRRVV